MVTDILSSLGTGFSAVLVPMNLLFCLIGTLIGTLIGVLPGIGPVATIAMLLPITFGLKPLSALIMLAGIYYGAQYGGSTTSILVNLPGEASSVVTCIDGYQMARKGRAGVALAIAALGSFFAGTVSTLLIAFFGPLLASFSEAFSSPEYFSLMVLGLISAIVLAHGSVTKAIAMIVLGLFLGLIGTDVSAGVERYTFRIPELTDGLGFVPIAMGVFGLSEIILNLETSGGPRVVMSEIRGLLPTWKDIRESWAPVVRGTFLGSILGVLPGGGAVLSSFASYTLEKRIARDPSRFGKGAIEGVAGPEAANNAAAQTSFIPLLTLGLPSNAVMALMMGAMIIQGIAPGPGVMQERPELFWGMVASMWVGNLMLVIINLPLIGIWVKLLRVPYRYLFPAILVFCCIGVYSLNSSPIEVVVMVIFGLVGYVFKKTGCEGAPFLLGFILGPLMEENLRRAMLIARGNPIVFLNRPISAVLLAFSAFLLLLVILPNVRKKREEAFRE
jgi:putative tricarboxylic transport membrane protein